MYFSVVDKQISICSLKDRKPKTFCRNPFTNQLLIVFSESQWAVYDMAFGIQGKGNNKYRQNSMEQEMRQNEQQSNQDYDYDFQGILRVEINTIFVPKTIKYYKKYFVWLSDNHSQIHFLCFKATQVEKSKTKQFKMTTFDLQKKENQTDCSFQIDSGMLFVMNKAKYKDSLKIEVYSLKESLEQLPPNSPVHQKNLSLSPLCASPEIPQISHKLCRFVPALRSYLFFEQIYAPNCQIDLFKFSIDGNSEIMSLKLENHAIDCIRHEQEGKIIVLDVVCYEGGLYLVLNTFLGVEVRSISHKLNQKKFHLQKYTAIQSFTIESTLVLLCQNRDGDTSDELILTNFQTFEVMANFRFEQNSPLQELHLSGEDIVIFGGKGWQLIRLLKKQVCYMKILTELEGKQSCQNRFKGIEVLYEHILDIL